MARKLSPEKREILSRFEDYLASQDELSQDNLNVLAILPELLRLQNEKSLIYGRSWCKHGELSAFFNLERKWDRIQNIMEHAMVEGTDYVHSDKASTPTETFTDTIADLANYSLMWVGYIKEKYPEEWQSFVEANKLEDAREDD